MSNKHLYNVYICTCTGAQNTCSKVYATPTGRKMHIERWCCLLENRWEDQLCIYIHTCAYAYICTQSRMRIHDTAPHANDSLLRLTTYVKIYIHILIHMYIHVYTYLYIYTCIYVHTYMFLHTHTCTYIRTHIQHVHIHARKHAWNNVSASTAWEAWLYTRKFRPSPCPLQFGRELLSMTSSPVDLFSRNDR